MGILNNYWNLLTTENELLTKIIVSPTIFIEAWILFKIFATIFDIKYTKKEECIYIISLSVISKILEFTIPTPYNVIANYLVMFLLITLIFKTSKITSSLCVLLPICVFAIIGNLILNPLLKIFDISSSKLYITPYYRMIYLCCCYIMCYFFTFIIKIFKHNFCISISLIKNLERNSKQLIFLNIMFGLFTIIIQILITFYYINIFSIIFTLLNFVSLLSYFLISIFSLTKTTRLYVTTQNLENAENYNETLTYLYDNVRAFKHDFDNMIFIIGGFIDKNDISGLKKYYKNLEKDCERVNNIALLNPELINNSGIYNLLTAKYKKAEENKVEIHLEFFFDFNKLKMPIYDFSRILGILLDNAIEASKDTNEKQVFIIIRDSSRNNTQIVNIKNNYINKNIDTTKIFEKGITEKENHSGIGLWEVSQILKRNNNINLITKKDDTYFEQNLEIYY